MAGLLAFDADQHVGAIAPLAISKGVRIFLPYYKLFSIMDRDQIFAAAAAHIIVAADPEWEDVQAGKRPSTGVDVGIIPIFETSAERGLAGASTGAEDAAAIRKYMIDVNQPRGTAYILTFDFDEQASQDAACRGYAYAVQQGLPGYVMVAYGNGALAEGLKAQGIAKFAWDAGGMGMRGTRADIAAGTEDMQQDVGDVRGLHLGISIDSDFAPHANSPADLCAWMAKAPASVTTGAAAPSASAASQPNSPLPPLTDAQAFLKGEGNYTGDIDGIWGPQTAAAFAAHYANSAT